MGREAVFLTDSLSAQQALMSGEPDITQKKLTENISTLVQTTCVVLQWIPAHTGIGGGEGGDKIADQLSKEGREKEQPHHICPTEKSKLIRNKKKAICVRARALDGVVVREKERKRAYVHEQVNVRA